MAFLGYRFLGRLGWVPVVLVALSPWLLRYAAEVKPYGMDATLTVLVVLLTVYVIDRQLAPRPLAVWAVVGAAVAFLSWPGLLALGCGGGVLGLRALVGLARDRRPRALGWVAGANLPWLAVFGWQYLTVMRSAPATIPSSRTTGSPDIHRAGMRSAPGCAPPCGRSSPTPSPCG